ncbi:hypothetical protein FA95DRAFT_1411772 [Auriscalpium vulgare]|uniref:Uncharacterized protein n=1 Tax=Auriscalpium vulgare TaxID=40419 RepID=A0ACB8RQH3_9AGAM|nr:hypothetical protein FA95DRAFT_1411772 [Auriscalpium vulgare]
MGSRTSLHITTALPGWDLRSRLLYLAKTLFFASIHPTPPSSPKTPAACSPPTHCLAHCTPPKLARRADIPPPRVRPDISAARQLAIFSSYPCAV